jgi:hypothetical protein
MFTVARSDFGSQREFFAFAMALLPTSDHGLLFEVSLILLDTYYDSFRRVKARRKASTYTGEHNIHTKTNIHAPIGILSHYSRNRAAKTYALHHMYFKTFSVTPIIILCI